MLFKMRRQVVKEMSLLQHTTKLYSHFLLMDVRMYKVIDLGFYK